MSELLKQSESVTHNFLNGAIIVDEYNFEDNSINDAEIRITGRYPLEGFAVNDKSLALISVESGAGSIALGGFNENALEIGDRLLIKPGEPYALTAIGELVIRYIATPAWTASQARVISSTQSEH